VIEDGLAGGAVLDGYPVDVRRRDACFCPGFGLEIRLMASISMHPSGSIPGSLLPPTEICPQPQVPRGCLLPGHKSPRLDWRRQRKINTCLVCT
jgi:hypothetical protein